MISKSNYVNSPLFILNDHGIFTQIQILLLTSYLAIRMLNLTSRLRTKFLKELVWVAAYYCSVQKQWFVIRCK